MLLFFVVIFIIIIFLLIYCFLYIISVKTDIFCVNFNNLQNIFLHNKTKTSYKKLPRSNTIKFVNEIYDCDLKQLQTQKIIFNNKKFILTISKLIDYKINSNKQKYRAKENKILINEISTLIATNILKSNQNNLFKNYKELINIFSLRQKENKIFKILLAQKLILLLYKINSELNEISYIITKSKSVKKLKKFNKQILWSAQIYSIKNFNSNSTKILFNKNINEKNIINNFFLELYEAENKIRRIITYLVTMFS